MMPKLVILVFGILCHHLGQTLDDQIAMETASSYSSSYPHSISILPAPAEIKAQYAPSVNEDEVEESKMLWTNQVSDLKKVLGSS